MEILRMPREMQNRGITGWPKILLVGPEEETPEGVPFIRATKQDYVLTFRLMVPLLMESQPQFDWPAIFFQLTGRKYKAVMISAFNPVHNNTNPGAEYGYGGETESPMSLVEMAGDLSSYIDLNLLLEMKMIPAFFTDVAEAIKVNVTNSFAWQDGYNKKTGVCSGSLIEQSRKKSLVILDTSSSIPAAVSSGMMTLIKTITDITHADLILTGSQSFFFENSEVRDLDIEYWHRRVGKANESEMFKAILEEHDMDYDCVITFGDSDCPGTIKLNQRINTKKWYSFFVTRYDRYGNSAEYGTGYGRWVKEANPNVEVIHSTDWVKAFPSNEG